MPPFSQTDHSNLHKTMPALTLISHPLCPFVQRAAIVLLEKHVSFERINVDLNDKPEWFLAISPTGKVPVLQVGKSDATKETVFESVAICEYLQETQPGPSLHPDDPLARAKHRAWIEFGSATLGDAWGYLNAKDDVGAKAKVTAFKEKLAQLEKVLDLGPYFDGQTFSMVDAVFAPIFRYFDVLPTDIGAPLFAEFPQVAAWRKTLGMRASVTAAVSADFPTLFRAHLRRENALLADRA